MADPTAQDFFGAADGAAPSGAPTAPGALPTADQFFNHAQPESGAAHDTIWSSMASAGGRILNSVGYGAADKWGSEPLGLNPETEGALRQLGVLPDYQKAHTTFYQSANEAVIRPAAAAADAAMRSMGAVVGAATSGAQQVAEEIKGRKPGAVRGALAYLFAAAAEMGEDVQGGALGEFPAFAEEGMTARSAGAVAAADSERAIQAAKARSVGAVGEGEGAYYGAEPITPENLQARANAAQEAGIEATPKPEPPAPDIHELARRVDPETFQQYDALVAQAQEARQSLASMAAEREARPEAMAARDDLHELLGLERGETVSAQALEGRLEAVASSAPESLLSKVAAAYDRYDALLNDDTPEMMEARKRLVETDLALRDLAPDMSQAYRHAADLAPDQFPAEREAEKVMAAGAKGNGAEGGGKPGGGAAEPGQEAPGPTPAATQPVAAEGAGDKTIAPASVTGKQELGEDLGVNEISSQGKGRAAIPGTQRPIEGTGELATRGLSEGVEAKAIEDSLTTGFGDLPEYRTLSMADQAEQTTSLIAKDYETAKAIAMGEKQPPKGLLPESVFVGVEKRALAEGDVETLRQLATRSKLTTAATTMGQRIRTLGERDQASPVGHIQEVQKAREESLAKRMDIEAAKRETVPEIRAEVRRAAVKPAAWEDFISILKCGE